jgi:hypothetical protein
MHLDQMRKLFLARQSELAPNVQNDDFTLLDLDGLDELLMADRFQIDDGYLGWRSDFAALRE